MDDKNQLVVTDPIMKAAIHDSLTNALATYLYGSFPKGCSTFDAYKRIAEGGLTVLNHMLTEENMETI
jgi:hypothetical protein